ncbi:L-histidine N(alpha)-methyltransferase [Actinoplanes sp. HUAS TT8]|uniref:L-histidine N(alpha)-methyltransferase n=1 Tax=Actinoplanes sp. HUAS TT8 TaxID=3447453 RepID=UPI003F526B5B
MALTSVDASRPPASYFESADHRRTVVEAVVAGHVPLKFAYAGSAAFTHDRYASTDDYASMLASVAHDADVLRSLYPELAAFAEIGPGNGRRTAAMLTYLASLGQPVGRYLGLDFSATLLDIAAARVRAGAGPDCSVDTMVWDVEHSPSPGVERWRRGDDPIVLGMVGHTLGNLEDPVAALQNLAVALRLGDILLLSVLLRRPAELMRSSIAAYHSQEFRCAALEPLLAAGLRSADLEFEVDYHDDAFIGRVTLLRDVRLDDKPLPHGYQFRCFLSRRFDADEVVQMVEKAGWSICRTAIDWDSDHMTVVASRG